MFEFQTNSENITLYIIAAIGIYAAGIAYYLIWNENRIRNKNKKQLK